MELNYLEHIKKLWLLNLLIEQGNFRDAALHAQITQSAISQTLTFLEQLTGQIIVHRERGRLTPTPFCRHILRKARPILEAIDIANINSNGSIPTLDIVNFGAYESLALDILPSLISRLQFRNSRLKFTLRIARSSQLLQMVKKGEVGMALTVETGQIGQLASITVAKDRLGIFVSSTTPVTARNSSQLDNFDFGILAPGSDGHPLYFKKFLKSAGIKKKPLLLSDSFEALRLSCESGAVAAVLPLRVACRTPRALVEIRLPDSNANNRGLHDICLVSRRDWEIEGTSYLALELQELFREQERHIRINSGASIT